MTPSALSCWCLCLLADITVMVKSQVIMTVVLSSSSLWSPLSFVVVVIVAILVAVAVLVVLVLVLVLANDTQLP